LTFFIGNLDVEVKSGYGRHQWSNGDSYDGQWKDNKMEGAGIFRHVGDVPLEGVFKNNYYHMGGDVYVSPFQSRAEIDNFIQSRDEHRKLKESRIKEKMFKLEVINKISQLDQLITFSAKNNRVPLILSSKAFYTNINELIAALNKIEGKPEGFSIEIFDMRRAKVELQHGNFDGYMAKTKIGLATAIANGGLFVINVDDSDVEYTELYDPDLKEFYVRQCFPAQILLRKELKIREVYKKVLEGTEFEGQNFNENFRVSFVDFNAFFS